VHVWRTAPPRGWAVIDVTALITAYRTRLLDDPTVAADVSGVHQLIIPGTETWAKRVIEIGEADEGAWDTYGSRGGELLLRVKAMERGPEPGVGNTDGMYALLIEIDRVMLAKPWPDGVRSIRRIRRIPPAAPVDDQGYYRLQAGNIYRLLVREV